MSLVQKKAAILEFFAPCKNNSDLYEKIIELGRNLPDLDKKLCTPERLVEGCQSVMYLKADLIDGKMHFSLFSEALISKGLAALLIRFYEGETPESILKTPPEFIQELSIAASLTPGRSNGLASLYQKIKRIALLFYMQLSGTASE